MDILISLVYSVVLLFIMIYPSMQIIEFIGKKVAINENLYNKLTVILTIVLALSTGALLRFVE